MPQLSLPSYQPYVPSEAPEAETSMLAREAFRAGVSLQTARRALVHLREGVEASETELRFLSGFFCLNESDQTLLRESV